MGSEMCIRDRRHEEGAQWQFIMAEVLCDHAPAHGGDPVFAGEVQIGSVTSAGYGARTDKNLVFAFVKADADLSDLSVGIIGEPYKAHHLESPVFDPETTIPRQN